uniref:Ribosomal protein S3 n=1 Tax=Tetrahymena paravorax TaxID=5905 RepID=Q09F77_TETPR|nr:ribosomal protein S3 [Tetrahymena paravorax]ABI51674.1 ribosomal protein S3 [Tetrahymena paravorax]
MGLKSLPILNKSGVSMFWENIWDSIKLYKKYNLSFFYLNDLISYFFNENLYYYCIMKIRILGEGYRGIRGYKHISISKLKKTWNMRNFYLGRITFYKTQSWIIVSINYYTVKRFKLYKKYKNSKNFKNLFKSFNLNFLKFKHKIEYYKYKF